MKGVLKEDDWNGIATDIKFDFARDNHFAELKDYEILSERMNILRDVNDYVGKYYSTEWIRRNILRQSDSQMKDIDNEISREREEGIITDDGEY